MCVRTYSCLISQSPPQPGLYICLFCVFQSLRALIDSCKCDEENGDGGLSDSRGVRAVFLFDHEEIGSKSCEGAAGTLLPDCMKRRVSRNLFLMSWVV